MYQKECGKFSFTNIPNLSDLMKNIPRTLSREEELAAIAVDLRMELTSTNSILSEKCKTQQELLSKAKTEKRVMTEDEMKQFDDLQKEIENLQKQIKIEEQAKENEKFLDEPTTEKVHPTDMSTQKDRLDDGGFKNIGEFLNCVKSGDSKGRLKALSTSDVGIMIPPQFSTSILQLNGEDELVMPRATNIPAGNPPDAPFTIPYLQQGSDGVLGGIQLTWTGEAKTVSDVKDPVIKDLTLEPCEVSGLATVNNKTLQNWEASGTLVQSMMRMAYVNGRDAKFLKGIGSGCPLGILNADGAIKISRKTAGTFKYEDAANMLARLLPDALNGAFWNMSLTMLPTLVTMADSSGRLVYMPGNVAAGIPSTLLGIPVKFTGKMPVSGSEGDVLLTNYKYYLTKAGSGPYVSISEHVKFTTNQTVFKIVANIDGQPWVKDPLTLEDGKTTVSPYIILK